MTTIGSASSASLFNPALNAQPVRRPAKPVFGHISAIRQTHGQMSAGRVNTDNAGTSAQPLDALKERALNTPVSTHFDKFSHHSLKAEIKDKLPSFSGVKGLSGRNKKLAETLLALLQQLKTEAPDKFDKGDSRSLGALFKQADSYKGSEKDFVRKFWKEAAPLITKFGSAVFDRLHNEVTELSEQAWLKKAGGSEIGERQVFDAHYRRSAELTAGELDRTGQHILPEIVRDNFENAWRKIISIPHTLVPCPPAGETPEQPNQAADEPDASAGPDVQFQPDEKNGTPDNTQPIVINYNDNRITIGGDNYHLYADDTKAQGVNESGERCENGNDNPPVFSGIKDALVKVSNQAGNQTDETDSLPPHADKATQINSGYFDYDVPELALNSDLSTDTDGLTGPENAGSQPETVAVPASRTEQATEMAEPAGAGKKWATVQPAAPFIGGSGSARAAGNTPGRSTGSGTNDGVAVPSLASATTQTVTGSSVPGAGKTPAAGSTVMPEAEDNTFTLTPRPVTRTARIVSRDNEETGRPEKRMSGTDAGHKVMDGMEVDGKMTDAFCDRELSHFVTLLRAQPEAAALKLEHIRHPAHLATLVKSAFTRGVYWEAGAHRGRVLKSGLEKYQQTDGYRALVKAVENGRVQSDRLHDFYFQLGRIAAGQTPNGDRQSRPVYLTEAKPASLNSRALFANTLPEKS